MDFNKITYDICRHYLADRKPVLSESLYNILFGAIRRRDLELLATCSSMKRPSANLESRGELQTLMQIEAFFKKNTAFTNPVASRLAAFISFEEAEAQCKATNHRLCDASRNPHHYDGEILKLVKRMESDIDRILGDFHPFLEELPKLVRFTSGASATKSRRKAMPPEKVSLAMCCSPRAEKYITALAKYFGYQRTRCIRSRTNRVEFVKKSWKTDRTIACEQEGNMALQLAFDTYAKRRLRRIGIDLSKQDKNQELARIGSIDGSLATIDLSMASDTLAFNTVVTLFPYAWLKYLEDIRSISAEAPVGIRYEKFSSMGNGSTFPIETLVFAAACRALGSKRYSVYGDDIVIETELAPKLMDLLGFLGFSLNTEKSFTEGPFRESCGSNWYEGSDITPVYLRDMDKRKAFLCHTVNTLASIARPFGHLWYLLQEYILEWDLPFVPYNDSTISGVWIHPYHAYREGLLRSKDQILKFRGYIPKSPKIEYFDSRALFLWFLRAMSVERMSYAEDRHFPVKGHAPPYVSVVSSLYSSLSHKYVRDWVFWKVPEAGTPDHLFWWSEELTRRNG